MSNEQPTRTMRSGPTPKDMEDVMAQLVQHEAVSAELVNHPSHYGGDTQYEVIKVLREWLDRLSGVYTPMELWTLGTVIKYLPRAGLKGEVNQQITDLEKAQWYLKHLIDLVKERRATELLKEKQG